MTTDEDGRTLLQEDERAPLHAAMLRVGLRELAHALDLPADLTIASIQVEPQTGALMLLLVGERLPAWEQARGQYPSQARIWVEQHRDHAGDVWWRRVKFEAPA